MTTDMTETNKCSMPLRSVGAVRQYLKKRGVTVYVSARFKEDVQSVKTTKAEALHLMRAYSNDEALEGYDVAYYFPGSNSIFL
jgi:hypothetical protein